MSEKKYTQLDYKSRCIIEHLLNKKTPISEIAETVGVSRQTIYREVARNSKTIAARDATHAKPSCVHWLECYRNKGKKAATAVCPTDCPRYEKGFACPKLSAPHKTCNGCSSRKKHVGMCGMLGRYYEAESAGMSYHGRISGAHARWPADADVAEVKRAVEGLIRKGQSVEVVLHNHPEVGVSAATLRRWIRMGLMPGLGGQLRMDGRIRAKKGYDNSKKHDAVSLSAKKEGHRYSDFLVYVANHPGCPITQLDTVIGKSEWPMKSALTIHVVRKHFQFGRMLESHCKEQVNAKMREILAALKKKQDETGVAVFDQFASCVIADNGIEFDDLIDLEGEFPGLHVYYTRAYASSDKAECERNHVLVRYIRYKGISWSDVDEEALNKLFDNINSYPRKSLGYEKPYRKVVQDIGREFVEAVGAKEVDVDDVNLRPDLLKK